MARTGRPIADLVLSDDEREQLVRWARRRKSSQALALRSRIVLECASGDANTVVAQRLGVSRPTVGKWRSRFLEHRLDGLVDDPRPGRPATVSAQQVEDVVVATLESTPANATGGKPQPGDADGSSDLRVSPALLKSLQKPKTR